MNRIKMMFGEVVEEPLTDEYIKKNIDDVSSDSREVLIQKLHDYIRELVKLNDVVIAIQNACEQEIDEWYDNTKSSMDDCPDYELLQGRVEFAEQISNLIGEEEVDEDTLPERKY